MITAMQERYFLFNTGYFNNDSKNKSVLLKLDVFLDEKFHKRKNIQSIKFHMEFFSC